MAIEYADSGDQENMQDQTEPGEAQEGGDTVDVPSSMLPDQNVQPGDVIRLEVVSNNKDSGTITCKYATGNPMGGGGIAGAAQKFEE
jgi:hypothetical protein